MESALGGLGLHVEAARSAAFLPKTGLTAGRCGSGPAVPFQVRVLPRGDREAGGERCERIFPCSPLAVVRDDMVAVLHRVAREVALGVVFPGPDCLPPQPPDDDL